MSRARSDGAGGGRHIPSIVILVELLAVVVATIAVAVGASVLVGILVGLVIAAFGAVALLVRAGGMTPLDRWALWRGRAERRAAATIEPVDAPADSGAPIGILRDGTHVVAVVEVVPTGSAVTLLSRDGAWSRPTLPIGDIVRATRRHDVVLDAVDIVSHGRRLGPRTPAAQVYSRLVGPLPAVAHRTVWLVLRLDAAACRDAVERRGGGLDGAARTVGVAAGRVVRALEDAGLRGRILRAEAVSAAMLDVTDGVPRDRVTTSRDGARTGAGLSRAAVVEPAALDAAATTAVWARPSHSTTTVLRVRPVDDDRSRTSALVRETVDEGTVPGEIGPGVRTLRGLHREGTIAALPIGALGLESLASSALLGTDRLDGWDLPVTGCGQLVGSDDAGRAVAARLTGPDVRTVCLAGELYLALQVVFRAVATGARVVVHTDRPQAWRTLVDGAAGPDRLRIAGEHRDDRNIETVVFDGLRPTHVRTDVTTIHVHAHPDQWPVRDPDVAIVQPGAIGDRVALTVAGSTHDVLLVAIADETVFTGRGRDG